MSAPAWMPLYIADYLADTGHLSTVEHGAYLLLIMHYWQNSGLPIDDAKLARICRLPLKQWQAIRSTIAELFGDDWRHGRIDAELAKAADTISKRSAAGRAAACARHNKRNANAPSNAQQTDTPIPSPVPEEGSVANATDAGASPAGTVLDLKRELWDRARALLGKHGIAKQQAGSLIGKWLKNLGPPDGETRLLHILAHAEAHCEGNIVEYVEGSIRRSGNVQRTQQGGYTGTAAAIAGISAAAGE